MRHASVDMVCTLLNVRKSHLASMKCKKTLGSRGFAPDPAGGGVTAFSRPLAGGEGAGCLLQKSTSAAGTGFSSSSLTCARNPDFWTPELKSYGLKLFLFRWCCWSSVPQTTTIFSDAIKRKRQSQNIKASRLPSDGFIQCWNATAISDLFFFAKFGLNLPFALVLK